MTAYGTLTEKYRYGYSLIFAFSGFHTTVTQLHSFVVGIRCSARFSSIDAAKVLVPLVRVRAEALGGIRSTAISTTFAEGAPGQFPMNRVGSMPAHQKVVKVAVFRKRNNAGHKRHRGVTYGIGCERSAQAGHHIVDRDRFYGDAVFVFDLAVAHIDRFADLIVCGLIERFDLFAEIGRLYVIVVNEYAPS